MWYYKFFESTVLRQDIFSDDAGRIEFILLRSKIITSKEILNLFHFFRF